MKVLLFIFFNLVCFSIQAQKILKNINSGTDNSNPHSAITINQKTYFLAYDNFTKLYCFDKALDSTYQVGSYDYLFAINKIFEFKGELYVFATSSLEGNELLKLDVANNTLNSFKNFVSGSNGVVLGEVTFGDNLMYFSLQSPQELWVSDGTVVNTKKLIDLTYESLDKRKCVGDKLFFLNSTPTYGKELWVSDGDVLGTNMVKDISMGVYDAYIFHMESIGNNLIFNAYNTTYNHELWKSDGTAINTQMIEDLELGVNGSSPNSFIKFNDEIYFNARGNKFYKTNGNTITFLKDLFIKNQGVVFNNNLYFSGFTSDFGLELWKTDGTSDGTVLVTDVYPGASSGLMDSFSGLNIEIAGLNIIFKANDGVNGIELWKHDGINTSMLKDFVSGPSDSFIGDFYNVGNEVVFSAVYGGGKRELWVTDGTTLGTKTIVDLNPSLGISNTFPLVKNGSDFIFVGFDDNVGFEPFRYNSTTKVISFLKDLNKNPRRTTQNFHQDFGFQKLGENFIFFANDNKSGEELWVTNGKTQETYLLKDFTPFSYDYYNQKQAIYHSSSYLNCFHKLNDAIYFVVNNSQLWKINETLQLELIFDLGNISFESGTVRMKEKMLVLENKIYFNFGPNKSIYESDGTTLGTFVLSSNFFDSNLYGFIGQSLIFTANQYPYGKELFKLTNGVTELIKDIYPDYFSAIPNVDDIHFELNGNVILFEANDGVNGNELWATDGTAGGTQILKDFNLGSGSSFFNQNLFRKIGNEIIFGANDHINGNELWKTNGTTLGTTLVKDISAGALSSNFNYYVFQVDENHFVYQIDDNVNGQEPWITDGTSAGTKLIKDFSLGQASAYPNPEIGFTKFENSLYFEVNGYIWKYELTSEVSTQVSFLQGVTKNGKIFIHDNALFCFGSIYQNNEYKVLLFKKEGEVFQQLKGFELSLGNDQPFQIFFPNILNDKLIFKIYSNDEEFYVSDICKELEVVNYAINQSSTIKANNLVSSSNSISTTENVFFTSEKAVQLNPGFSTNNSGVFLAEILGCKTLHE